MKITYPQPDVAVMNPGGTFEEKEVRWLIDEIGKLFLKKTPKILIDFSRVHYLRSSSAAILVGLMSLSREKNCQVAVISPTPQVKEIFDMLGVGQIMPLFPSEDEAIESLGSGGGDDGR